LSRYLSQGREASLQPALRLGLRAAAIGLEILDMAVAHERAMMARLLSRAPSGVRLIARAKAFFAEVIAPIEATHSAAQKGELHVRRLTRTLNRRTVESSAANRRLKRVIAERRVVEDALAKSREHLTRLLRESARLHGRMRHRARSLLSAHEDQRRTTSRRLQDEIAQTLLAINVRLLTWKSSARSNMENLENEIAATQRLVEQSAGMIRRVARELGVQHEA
jgi:signal transduction histidine kinase